jgi:Protein of unknown function (DUF3800)
MTFKHVAYFDESGDHGLETIDPGFPAFVLCGCVYQIDEYLRAEAPAFSAIKFANFGHDAVVMHSRQIRKQLGPFKILQNPLVRKRFLAEIASFFQNSKATIIAAAIRKDRHKNQYKYPSDPYDVALLFCLERLYGFMKDCGDDANPVTCVFEQRGDAEDQRLAKVFKAACDGANHWGCKLPFEMVFASKQQNMPGLQVADLAAYPIARHVIDPDAPNRAFAVIEPRFRRSPNGRVIGWGLKIFP